MPDVVGLVAAIFALGSPAYIVAKIQEHRTKRKQMELEAAKLQSQHSGMDPKERKLLMERIENLETIVCSVDLELNQKLVKLIDEQRMLGPGTGEVPAPA